jgi:hypothetical protein
LLHGLNESDFNSIFKVDFVVNDELLKLKEESVGSINCNYDTLLDKLDVSHAENIELGRKPTHTIHLKNGNLLTRDKNFLALHDMNFNLICELDKINNEPIRPFRIAADKDENVYVTNDANNTLYKLDSNLKYIKSTDNHDIHYSDIFIHGDKLYACARSIKRIDVMTLDFELVSSSYLEHVPLQIRIINNTACVQAKLDGAYRTCFYQLPSFRLTFVYDRRGPLLAHDKHFYVYENGAFVVFDQSGRFLVEKEAKLGQAAFCDVGLNFTNNELYMCMIDNKLCKIKTF